MRKYPGSSVGLSWTFLLLEKLCFDFIYWRGREMKFQQGTRYPVAAPDGCHSLADTTVFFSRVETTFRHRSFVVPGLTVRVRIVSWSSSRRDRRTLGTVLLSVILGAHRNDIARERDLGIGHCVSPNLACLRTRARRNPAKVTPRHFLPSRPASWGNAW